MRSYSSTESGAGITQLAECQLPKLNVAGSTPVTRSMLLLLSLLLFGASLSAAFTPDEFWLRASGQELISDGMLQPASHSETSLRNQLKNGNRNALLPLIRLLVASGRIEDAEIWMEGRGRIIPVTRRDLGIALSWYGRFDLYEIMTFDLPIPPDIADDDYAPTLAAILYFGWMNSSQDGCFHPDLLAGQSDLDLLADEFFDDSYHWEGNWIGMRSLDSLFARGVSEESGQ